MSLEIKNLYKSFQQNENKIQVIKDLNLFLKKGEVIAVIGPSGSGKSTFLSLLSGLEPADSGEIWVNGINLLQMNEVELTRYRASQIAIVFQQYHLIQHLTALENVSLALEILKRPEAIVQAKKLLQEVGLEHRYHHFPSQLSGGECQRVAIARALAVEPSLILADEPSGNLDVETGDKVMSVFLQKIQQHQVTTIVVTHSEALAQRCQRIFKLQQGQLVEISKKIGASV